MPSFPRVSAFQFVFGFLVFAWIAAGIWRVAALLEDFSKEEPAAPRQESDWEKPAWKRANYASEIARFGEHHAGGAGI